MIDPTLLSTLFDKLSAIKPQQADALFVHMWPDMQEAMNAFINEYYDRFHPAHIVLNGRNFYSINVPDDCVSDVWEASHTGDEARAFVAFAKQHNLKRAVIVTNPYHLMRAFLTDLGMMQMGDYHFSLIPCTIGPIDWNHRVAIEKFTGVKESASRLGLLASDSVRIVEYDREVQNGNPDFVIASVEDGLAYLNSQHL